MDFWFHEYDSETLQKPFIKINFLKYLHIAISNVEQEDDHPTFSDNRLENRLQTHLIEQTELLKEFVEELEKMMDERNGLLKEFLGVARVFFQVEGLYFIQFWGLECGIEFTIDRLMASFIRFYRFLVDFQKNFYSKNKFTRIKSKEINENAILKIFNHNHALINTEKEAQLLIPQDYLTSLQEYLKCSLQDIVNTMEKSILGKMEEKTMIKQILYFVENFIELDNTSILFDLKIRFPAAEDFLINKILMGNNNALATIHEIQKELDFIRNNGINDQSEKGLLDSDNKLIEGIADQLYDQFSPHRKIVKEEEIVLEKTFTKQTSTTGNRESINFELEKKQMKRATNLKTVDIDSRKTLLKEDVDTSKKSKLGQNLFPLSFNKEKNNAKIDNKNKNLNFNKQIHSLGKQYEKSDSITDNNLPVFVSKYKFDKDYIENYNSLQPQIESQKNLSSALDDLRYINSPNFLSEDSNNPLMSWIKLKDFKPNSPTCSPPALLQSSFYSSNSTSIPQPSSPSSLLFQINDKLSQNFLNNLLTINADIKQEEIKFELPVDEKKEDENKKKKMGGTKITNQTLNTQKTEESENKDTKKNEKDEEEIEIQKSKNFFSKGKNAKKGNLTHKIKIEEGDFIKIDANTQIKGKLEYIQIDEKTAEDILDFELFDMNYKSEEVTEIEKEIKPKENKDVADFFKQLEKEEIKTLRRLGLNNSRTHWDRLRIYVKSSIIQKKIERVIESIELPDVKTRNVSFKKRLLVVSSNLMGNTYFF